MLAAAENENTQVKCLTISNLAQLQYLMSLYALKFDQKNGGGA